MLEYSPLECLSPAHTRTRKFQEEDDGSLVTWFSFAILSLNHMAVNT